MGAFLTWTDKTGESRVLRFDVVKSEQHESQAEVTSHPVESGPDVSDHMAVQLDRITLEVFVSNTPISGEDLFKPIGSPDKGLMQPAALDIVKYEAPFSPTPGAVFGAIGNAISSLLNGKQEIRANTLQWATEFNAVSKTFEVLKKLQQESTLIKVNTPMWDYENMVLLKASLPRNAQSGTSGTFTLELQELRIVETRQVSSPVPTEKRGEKKKPKGVKGPETLPEGPKKSLLKKGAQKAAGLIAKVTG